MANFVYPLAMKHGLDTFPSSMTFPFKCPLIREFAARHVGLSEGNGLMGSMAF